MSQSMHAHSYGPGCQLAQYAPTTASKGDDDMPPLKCQFFYSSRIGIDDPLSAIPVPGSTPVQHPPRPFSAYDNAALDYAWMGFSRREQDKTDEIASSSPNENDISTFGDIHPEQEGLAAKIAGLESESHAKDPSEGTFGNEPVVGRPQESFPTFGRTNSRKIAESLLDANRRQNMLARARDSENHPWKGNDITRRNSSSSRQTRKNELKGKSVRQSTMDDSGVDGPSTDPHSLPKAEHSQPARNRAGTYTGPDSPQGAESERKTSSPVQRSRSWSQKRQRHSLLSHEIDFTSGEPSSLPAYNNDTTITGQPFLRLPSRRGRETSTRASSVVDLEFESEHENPEQEIEQETIRGHNCKAQNNDNEQVHVPVGVSRLHHVQLPLLQMKPIYWSPAHDLAAVIRGSWFHADTMLPVEVGVANQLEMGYRELRVWSQTWSDEIKSAIDIGLPEAEEKIAHQLWKKDDEQKSSPGKVKEQTRSALSADPYCAAFCFNGEAAAEGVTERHDSDSKEPVKSTTRKYPNSQVVYKDARNAFILKPTLQPSAYYGRKVLQKIMRGTTVGMPVVRGFQRSVWEKLHPSEKSLSAAKAEDNVPIAVDKSSNKPKPTDCKACKHEEERPKVTDVIFVIHGIGQKMSERDSSWNFTHAVNSFRRSMNLEMSHKDVQKVLREDLGGIMVLPINWRGAFSLEEGAMKDEDKGLADHFTLDDITPSTIPAVRNMISDVMLDIPFYMSAHKPKMIQAVIAEANRVYLLWCLNNPGFVKEGRVHLIAHSLGSAMAIDILSKQPTLVSDYDSYSTETNRKHFDFNTTNLFLCGSPAGFFLYLEKAMLTPRKRQNKAGADAGEDQDKTLVNDVGTYGCLATDNLYNIMAAHDPIAYQLNAAVDPQYATSLKSATVPTATVSFFGSLSNVVRSRRGDSDPNIVKPPPGMKRLPSQLEMDVHDFTREEIAERKFNLLNDNGQIDWVLSSGGGPLENQYIDMLGAHSSYWESRDFVRFIVMEVGRKAGKAFVLPNMKAVKAGTIRMGQKSSSG